MFMFKILFMCKLLKIYRTTWFCYFKSLFYFLVMFGNVIVFPPNSPSWISHNSVFCFYFWYAIFFLREKFPNLEMEIYKLDMSAGRQNWRKKIYCLPPTLILLFWWSSSSSLLLLDFNVPCQSLEITVASLLQNAHHFINKVMDQFCWVLLLILIINFVWLWGNFYS